MTFPTKTKKSAIHIATLAMVAIAAMSQSARAQEPKAYTIANYPVEAQAKNAVAAKKAALAEGQQAAFRSLLKRIVPVSVYGRLDWVKSINAADYLSGISVLSEQNSATRYIANLDFIFSAEATRQLLRQQGVPFIDKPAPITTVIPVYRKSKDTPPVNGLGEWGQSWRALDIKNTITPISLIALKKSVHPDTLQQLYEGDAGALRNVSAEFGTGPIVFAFATPDPKNRKLVVTLKGRDASGDLSLKRNYPLDKNDIAYTLEYASVISLAIIEGRWKATRARSRGGINALSGPGIPMVLRVQFNNPGQWYKLQDQLRAMDGVRDLQVTAVSARSADVSLTFPGGGPQLANVMARKGLSLQNSGDIWLLRANYQ